MDCDDVIARLRSHANPRNVEGMARFGINPNNTLGVSIPAVRKIGKEAGKDHRLAQELWDTGIHEARILAALVDDPKEVSVAQMERWVMDFDSWDVCDQVCSNLFDRTPHAFDKAVEWSGREQEFVKRAGFALMAALAVHDKEADDGKFERFLPLIRRESTDERNFVRKAVNWALRQIGKRSWRLNANAVRTAREIKKIDSKAAKWIACDALRELEGSGTLRRIKR